jgi:hypothetical protein
MAADDDKETDKGEKTAAIDNKMVGAAASWQQAKWQQKMELGND